MKCYLHGPREGETIVINGVQFINGVADMPTLPIYFERYYNVKDYPPQERKYTLGTDGPEIFIPGRTGTMINPFQEKDKNLISQSIRDQIRDVILENPINKDEIITPRAVGGKVESNKTYLIGETPSESYISPEKMDSLKSEPSGEELLRMVVEAKKSEIEAKTATIEANLATGPSLVEQYLALDNQGKRIGFVKEHTGKIIRGKDEAVAYLTQLDKQNGF